MKKFYPLFLCLCLAGCTPLLLIAEAIEPSLHIYPQLPKNKSLQDSIQSKVNVTQIAEFAGLNAENYKIALNTLFKKLAIWQIPRNPLFLLERPLLDIKIEGWYSLDGSPVKYVLRDASTPSTRLGRNLYLFPLIFLCSFSSGAHMFD